MARLSVAPRAKDDAKFATFLDEYERRVEATPPGMCAVAMEPPTYCVRADAKRVASACRAARG